MRIPHIVAVAGAVLCTLGLPLSAQASDTSSVWSKVNFTGKALLAVSDADMQAEGYSTGVLNPLPGVEDALSVITFPHAGHAPEVQSIKASNSVTSWPQVIAVSPDKRVAYVIETRGEPADEIKSVGNVFTDLPTGKQLTSIDISIPNHPKILRSKEIANNPAHVSISPDGKLLAINGGDNGAEIYLVATEGGHLGEVQNFSAVHDPALGNISTLQWHPSGQYLSVTIENRYIAFYQVSRQADTYKLSMFGNVLDVGKSLTSGEFTPDGKFFIITDVKWGESVTSHLFSSRGSLISVKFGDSGQHAIVSSVDVGRSPEGFAMNLQGDMLVTVNMERTYLPSSFPTNIWPGTCYSSLSLVKLDPVSGELELADHQRFDGVLPESAAFDASGRSLAVAIFHLRDDPAQSGIIEFWNIEGDSDPKLVATGAKLNVVRGPHDMALVP